MLEAATKPKGLHRRHRTEHIDAKSLAFLETLHKDKIIKKKEPTCTAKNFRDFIMCCNRKNTLVPKRYSHIRHYSEQVGTTVSKPSPMIDEDLWEISEEGIDITFSNPMSVRDYTMKYNSSFHAMNANFINEKYIHSQNNPVTVGILPPQDLKIYGGQDYDGPLVERERVSYDKFEFLYDSEVGTKFRGTTYYISKLWTKEEDLLLISLQSKYKNNWKKVAEKLADKNSRKNVPKSDTDCAKRFHMITKIETVDSATEYSCIGEFEISNPNTQTKIKYLNNSEFLWNNENDDKLLHLVSTRGNNWKLFEKYFEGCSKYQIKQHYFKLKKEGRFPTGFEKELNQRTKRPRVKNKLECMPIIMEHSNEDMSEMRDMEGSLSIKLSLKDTVIDNSIPKSTTSSNKQFLQIIRSNNCSE